MTHQDRISAMSGSNPRRDDASKTLAELLFCMADPIARRQLEEFRIEYEAAYGRTDLTRNYTSMLPEEHRAWLLEHHPRHYWDGLPPFVKAFFHGRLKIAAREGKLDDMPERFIQLYCSGQATLEEDGPGSSRR